MTKQDPKEWFDQFPPNALMDQHRQWCARHWAPCPTFGANGIAASAHLMSLFIERVLDPAGIRGSDWEQANAKLDEIGRLCCWLGDDEMYAVWGRFPPAGHTSIHSQWPADEDRS